MFFTFFTSSFSFFSFPLLTNSSSISLYLSLSLSLSLFILIHTPILFLITLIQFHIPNPKKNLPQNFIFFKNTERERSFAFKESNLAL